MADYNMQCPMAAKRLIYSGMPATVEHGKPRCGTAAASPGQTAYSMLLMSIDFLNAF